MGARLRFECDGCGYSAEVSGGRDFGEQAVTHTVACAHCRALFDVLLGDVQSAVLHGPLTKAELARIRCPNGEGHTLSEWGATRLCPRCGEIMQALGGAMLWD